jgi:hypothetical protein
VKLAAASVRAAAANPARPGSHVVSSGSWRGLYQRDRHLGCWQLTVRCPLPGSALAGPQSQGMKLTITRPGPQGWPVIAGFGIAPPVRPPHVHPEIRTCERSSGRGRAQPSTVSLYAPHPLHFSTMLSIWPTGTPCASRTSHAPQSITTRGAASPRSTKAPSPVLTSTDRVPSAGSGITCSLMWCFWGGRLAARPAHAGAPTSSADLSGNTTVNPSGLPSDRARSGHARGLSQLDRWSR